MGHGTSVYKKVKFIIKSSNSKGGMLKLYFVLYMGITSL
jgi:hypothetical protein